MARGDYLRITSRAVPPRRASRRVTAYTLLTVTRVESESRETTIAPSPVSEEPKIDYLLVPTRISLQVIIDDWLGEMLSIVYFPRFSGTDDGCLDGTWN